MPSTSKTVFAIFQVSFLNQGDRKTAVLACYCSEGFTSFRENFSKNPLLGGSREMSEISYNFIVLIKGAGYGPQLQAAGRP